MEAAQFEEHNNIVRKVAWHPVSFMQSSGRLQASKVGGKEPFRKRDFSWPMCSECGEHKVFLLQLDMKTFPVEVENSSKLQSGLLQIFYCPKSFHSSVDVFLVPESELVPSLQNLAGLAMVKHGINIDKLPPTLKKWIKIYTEEPIFILSKEAEVASWEEYQGNADHNFGPEKQLFIYIPVKLWGPWRKVEDEDWIWDCKSCGKENMTVLLMEINYLFYVEDYDRDVGVEWEDYRVVYITFCLSCQLLSGISC